jgi:hypothetical protein
MGNVKDHGCRNRRGWYDSEKTGAFQENNGRSKYWGTEINSHTNMNKLNSLSGVGGAFILEGLS